MIRTQAEVSWQTIGFFVAAVLLSALSAMADEPKNAERLPRLILAHYMPWYVTKPASDQWGWHWTMNHFDPEQSNAGKRQLASQFYPLIGQVERLGMKFLICYEDQTLPALIKAKRLEANASVSHVVSEIDWVAQHWFTLKSYIRLNDRPVILSFGNAGLTNAEWTQAIQGLSGPVAYFSEHICRDGAVGGFDWPIPQEGLERTLRFGEISRAWTHAMPVVYPRFVDIYNEAKVSDGYVDIEDNDGKTFRASLEYALALTAPLIQLATWNDWGEGTNIEPSEEFGYRDLEILQQVRKKHMALRFAPGPGDLRMPRKLLDLRRLKVHRQQKLDAIAENIANVRLELAKRQIDYLLK